MITALHHVDIIVADLHVAAERYAKLFDCTPHRGDDNAHRVRFQLSNTAIELVESADSKDQGIASITFSTADIGRARHVIERRGIAVEVTNFDAKTLLLAPDATHGTRILITEHQAPHSPALLKNDSKLTGLDHIVITTANPDRAAALYGARLGLDMKLDRTNAQWGSRLIFFKCGDLIVEVACSLKNQDTAAPDNAWGLSLRTSNIEGCHSRLAREGFNVSDIRTGRKPGTQVFTVRDAPGNVPTLVIAKQS